MLFGCLICLLLFHKSCSFKYGFITFFFLFQHLKNSNLIKTHFELFCYLYFLVHSPILGVVICRLSFIALNLFICLFLSANLTSLRMIFCRFFDFSFSRGSLSLVDTYVRLNLPVYTGQKPGFTLLLIC